nr:enoyl-CoA hydratase/isomerase family protein [Candidatus Paracaedibacter symbiosus]
MQTTAATKLGIEAEIITSIIGKAGVISLNRPKALNAINVPMIRTLSKTLNDWQTDPAVEFVVICSNDSKAFCAGGDIRAVYAARLQDDFSFCDAIFREEYQLNYMISKYPKPYIALINGICMGGGMGISIHGSHRIVSENALLAMPETGIGYFPDIGASYFLNQCPGKIGTFMGVVGEIIDYADAIYTNLATHYVPSSNFPKLKQNLLTATSVEDALQHIEALTETAPNSSLAQHQSLIDHCFAADTVEAIIENLVAYGTPQASKWLHLLDKRSPTSLKISLALLQRNRGKSLKKCLPIEFRLSQRFSRKYDFLKAFAPSWWTRIILPIGNRAT